VPEHTDEDKNEDKDKEQWLGGIRAWATDAQGVLENVAKFFLVTLILGSMVYFAYQADPGRHPAPGHEVPYADRILSWSFAVFAVGSASLFVLLVILTVIGRIDLAQAFYDKPAGEEGAAAEEGGKDNARKTGVKKAGAKADAGADDEKPSASASNSTPPVSLARLQAGLWTTLIMTIYFHRVVKDTTNSLPAIPPELLMLMGISGATYLVSKSISASASTEKKKDAKEAEGRGDAKPKPDPKPKDGQNTDREENGPDPVKDPKAKPTDPPPGKK
jgi:hypothetical protein